MANTKVRVNIMTKYYIKIFMPIIIMMTLAFITEVRAMTNELRHNSHAKSDFNFYEEIHIPLESIEFNSENLKEILKGKNQEAIAKHISHLKKGIPSFSDIKSYLIYILKGIKNQSYHCSNYQANIYENFVNAVDCSLEELNETERLIIKINLSKIERALFY